jgi:hypothetical protein
MARAIENQAIVFGQWQIKIMQFLQQRHRVELHETGAALASSSSEIRSKPRKRAIRVSASPAPIELRRFGRAFTGLLLHAIQLRAQAGQRRAQVVGDVVAHAFDLVHQRSMRSSMALTMAASMSSSSRRLDSGRRWSGRRRRWPRRWPESRGCAAADGGATSASRRCRQDRQGHTPEQGMQNDPGDGEQRAVVAHQHQPAAILGWVATASQLSAGKVGSSESRSR